MDYTLNIKMLRVIHVMAMNKSVTKTAEHLNVSPGAISYMLKKARQETGSPLFLRTKEGIIPNKVAKHLSQRYINLAKEINKDSRAQLLNNKVVTISTYSLLEFLISVSVSSKKDFPILFEFSPPEMDCDTRLRRLRNKEIDIDIGTRLENDRSIIQTRLFSSNLSIFMSESNPKSKGSFTLQDWYDADHVRWSRRTDFICDDYEHANRFNNIMEQKKISMISSDSLNMAMLCSCTNHVMLMPEMLSQFLTNYLPVTLLPAPPELDMRFECFLHYHNSLHKDDVLRAILDKLQDVIK